jgi:hypothetical protein
MGQVSVLLQVLGHVKGQPDVGAVLGSGQRKELHQVHRVSLQLSTVAA